MGINSEEIRITSEEKVITSEEINKTSELMTINGGIIGIIGEGINRFYFTTTCRVICSACSSKSRPN
jgi:hypothetical protein